MARLDELEADEFNMAGDSDHPEEGTLSGPLNYLDDGKLSEVLNLRSTDKIEMDDASSAMSADGEESRPTAGSSQPPIFRSPSVVSEESRPISDNRSLSSGASQLQAHGAAIISGISGIVPSNLKASAVAIARSVAKRRSFKFLNRGQQPSDGASLASDDENDGASLYEGSLETNSMDLSFAIGANLGDVPLIDKRIFGKGDHARADVYFSGSENQYELAWEFFTKGDPSILFGLVFTPRFPKSLPFPESSSEPGSRQIIPIASVNGNPPRGYRGSISISTFPEGTFSLIWDNNSGNKKQP
ncbi:hypothetical protein BC829DRAFT_238580 [Chytridium lagenaria]|nr:hypothetical protein BC829DRAFT_238580 [Chytridium lagenaria]